MWKNCYVLNVCGISFYVLNIYETSCYVLNICGKNNHVVDRYLWDKLKHQVLTAGNCKGYLVLIAVI